MKSILLTLVQTKRGLEFLDNEFEDDLRRKSAVIFGCYAAVLFFFDFEERTGAYAFVITFFELTLHVFLSILVGMFCAYILFKIGQWLGGKANYLSLIHI